MTGEPVADWAAARSDKWRRHLAGLEAMLAPIDEPLVEALALTAPVRIADVGWRWRDDHRGAASCAR